MDPRTQRKLVAIIGLLLASAVGWSIPWSAAASDCSGVQTGCILSTFFRSAGLMVLRLLPLGIALLVAIAPRRRL